MRKGRIASLVIAALVAGVVTGNVVSGYAATTETPATTTAASGMGLRLGTAMRDAGARLADIVAKLTGMPVDEVQDLRQDGTSFADIAAKKDISAEKLVDSTLDARKDVLDSRVKDGSLTQDQADAAIDRMTDRVTERVSSEDAGCTGEGGGGQGMGGGRGKGGGRGMGRGAAEGQ